MKYQVIIKKLADSQFKIIKKSGDRKSLKRLQQILDELENSIPLQELATQNNLNIN